MLCPFGKAGGEISGCGMSGHDWKTSFHFLDQDATEMKAMILDKISSLDECRAPLKLVDLPDPVPGEKEILVRVSACGVCHTELDEIEGRTPPPRFPVVLGHQVVGGCKSSLL